MVENIKDSSLTDHLIHNPVKVQKTQFHDTLIDHEELTGILFLGVKGNINIDVSSDDSKLDVLA